MMGVPLFLMMILSGAQEGVSWYGQPDFRGDAILITESQADLILPAQSEPGSVFVPEGYQLELFSETRFQGRRYSTRSSIPDLAMTPFSEHMPGSLRLTWLGLDWPDLPIDTSAGVTAFSGPDLSGDYQLFAADEPVLKRTPLGAQPILSVLVAPGYTAVLYSGKNYHGRRLVLQSGRHNLSPDSWNRARFGSLRVYPDSMYPYLAQENPMPPDYAPLPVQVAGQVHVDVGGDAGDVLAVAAGVLIIAATVKAIKEERARTRVDRSAVLFDQPGFQGTSVMLSKSAKDLDIDKIAMPDPVSIIVPPRYEAVVYAEPNFQGQSQVLTGRVDNLDQLGQPIRSLRLRARR